MICAATGTETIGYDSNGRNDLRAVELPSGLRGCGYIHNINLSSLRITTKHNLPRSTSKPTVNMNHSVIFVQLLVDNSDRVNLSQGDRSGQGQGEISACGSGLGGQQDGSGLGQGSGSGLYTGYVTPGPETASTEEAEALSGGGVMEVDVLTRIQLQHTSHMQLTKQHHENIIQGAVHRNNLASSEVSNLRHEGCELRDQSLERYDEHEDLRYDLGEAEQRADSDAAMLVARKKRVHELEQACSSQRQHIEDASAVLGKRNGGDVPRDTLKRVSERSDMWWRTRFLSSKAASRELETLVREFSCPEPACPLCTARPTLLMVCCSAHTCGRCLTEDGKDLALGMGTLSVPMRRVAVCPHCKAAGITVLPLTVPVPRPGCKHMPVVID